MARVTSVFNFLSSNVLAITVAVIFSELIHVITDEVSVSSPSQIIV